MVTCSKADGKCKVTESLFVNVDWLNYGRACYFTAKE